MKKFYPDLSREKSRECNRRAFTLIEILIATTIFSIAITLILASMTSTFKYRYKGEATKSVQETGRQAMETMTNSIKGANGQVGTTSDPYPFYQIAFINSETGNPFPNNIPSDFDGLDPSGCKFSGTRLRTTSLVNNLQVIKDFALYDEENKIFVDSNDSACPSGQCSIKFKDLGDWQQLTPSNINITNLNFKGVYHRFIDSTFPQQKDYVEIAFTARTYPETSKAEEQDTAEFKTTVSPNNIVGQAGSFTAHLFVDPDHDGNYEDKGEYIETSIGTSGGSSQVYDSSWAASLFSTQKQFFNWDGSLYDGLNKLLDQRPEIRLVDSKQELIATAHLFKDIDNDGAWEPSEDQGIFIESTLDLSGGNQRCTASWTAWNSDEGEVIHRDNGYPIPDCSINEAKDWLVKEKIRVKFVTPDRRILGTARWFAEGEDRGEFISVSIGTYGDDQEVAEAHWLTMDGNTPRLKNLYQETLVRPSDAFDIALSLLKSQAPHLRLETEWSYND